MRNAKLRVMLLIQPNALREFEVDQLKKNGVEEIFLPKQIPHDVENSSASVIFDYDQNLTLSRRELEILNAQDWYSEPSQEAWEIVNRYFDIVYVAFYSQQLMSVTANFRGAIILRSFGLPSDLRYSDLIMSLGGERLVSNIISCGRRFWFGMGYSQLANDEDWYIKHRAIFLPAGLKDAVVSDKWDGVEKKIFFVCPRIETSSYFNTIYKKFINDFKGIDYLVGGNQLVRVDDDRVLGFDDAAQHEYNMTKLAVLFYHSQEINRIDYHPFEAVKVGMPLIFMGGGALDALGGKALPGRCMSVREARKKIEKILAGHKQLIDEIRSTQHVLLNTMNEEFYGPIWNTGFNRIVRELEQCRLENSLRPVRNMRKKIAVILPVEYRGEILRDAINLCNAIHYGASKNNESVDVIFCHINDSHIYSDEDFAEMSPGIGRRPIEWKFLSREEAIRSMRYVGIPEWKPDQPRYMVPDDGMRQLQDCDLWIFVSDFLEYPILPLRSYILMVRDCIQAYENVFPCNVDQKFINAARKAKRVWVTTDFAYKEILRYAGVCVKNITKVPMLTSNFRNVCFSKKNPKYFLWMTGKDAHENHVNFTKALNIYYEEFGGSMDCWVIGVNVGDYRTESLPHLKKMHAFVISKDVLRNKIKWCSELSDFQRSGILGNAEFLVHPTKIGSGTASVVEAARLGIPSISSDYPAMRELDERYQMNLIWINPGNPRNMAEEIIKMERCLEFLKPISPDISKWQKNVIEEQELIYWQEVKACL